MKKSHHSAVITKITELTHYKWHHQVSVMITSGSLRGQELSFRIKRRSMALRNGDQVTIEIWFEKRTKDGVDYYYIQGELI